MNNEDVLSAFEEWLRTQPFQTGIATVPVVLGVVREFAKAINLAEATDQEMNAFLRGDVDARSLVARIAQKAKVRLRYDQDQIDYAMKLFRDFRNHRKGE